MISEGSCDTEDWSNDAENTALISGINYSLIYIQTETVIWSYNNISKFLIKEMQPWWSEVSYLIIIIYIYIYIYFSFNQ